MSIQPLDRRRLPYHLLYQREVFSIEEHRVTHDPLQGWHCECPGFRADGDCDHLEQALAMQSRRSGNREVRADSATSL